MKQHLYAVRVSWTGNEGQGTKTYSGYKRDHTISVQGKAPVLASSDPSFRGDPTRHNPEELLVASLSSCHMLWYLHLCASAGVLVTGYADDAKGAMAEDSDGSGRFVEVILQPVVTIDSGSSDEKALSLHEVAHRFCFIANSVNFPVTVRAKIKRTANS